MASSQSEQFRARAEDCEVKAKAADDAEVRRMDRDMAAHFHQMAREQDDELGMPTTFETFDTRYGR